MGKKESPIYKAEYQHLLKQLRRARKDAEMTQQEVAKAFGVFQNFVSRCESGERRIDPIDLWRFAALYGQPFEFFLPGKKPFKTRING